MEFGARPVKRQKFLHIAALGLAQVDRFSLDGGFPRFGIELRHSSKSGLTQEGIQVISQTRQKSAIRDPVDNPTPT
jgi:hypothetical protein